MQRESEHISNLRSEAKRRRGLSENRSSVCKPVNIVVAKPRAAGRKKRRIEERNARGGGGKGPKSFFSFFFLFFLPSPPDSRCRRRGGVNACLLALSLSSGPRDMAEESIAHEERDRRRNV